MISKIAVSSISKKPMLIALGFALVITSFFICVVVKNTFTDESKSNVKDSSYQDLKANLDHAKQISESYNLKAKADEITPVIYSTDVKKAFENVNDKVNETIPSIETASHYAREYIDDEDFYKNYVSYKEKYAFIDRNELKGSSKDTAQLDETPNFVKKLIDKEKVANHDPKESKAKSDGYKAREDDFYRALSSRTKVNLTALDDDKYSSSPSSNGYVTDNQSNPFATNNSKNTEYSENTLDKYSSLKRNDFVLNESLENPKTPFALMQGTVIHAVLLSGINSELPGQISAQITRDIKDSIQGRFLLIPKGSKLLGQYSSNQAYGAQRVFLGFNRIIFPTGQSLNIGSVPGQSTDGYSGFDADVNNHYFRIITNCILLSTITAATAQYDNSNLNEYGNLKNSAIPGNELSHNISDALSNIIQKNMNISPTLQVKPGYAFTISLTQDIFFQSPYGTKKHDYFIQ